MEKFEKYRKCPALLVRHARPADRPPPLLVGDAQRPHRQRVPLPAPRHGALPRGRGQDPAPVTTRVTTRVTRVVVGGGGEGGGRR